MRICRTEGCEREVAGLGHAYCRDCLAVVLRTGAPPVIQRLPEWVRRQQTNALPAKDYSGSRAA